MAWTFLFSLAFADDPAPAAPAPDAALATAEPDPATQAEAFDSALGRKKGDVSLLGGKAVLHVPDSFDYLSPQDCDKVLQQWGNPTDASTLGMLLSSGASIFSPDTWAVIISYSNDGHVSDEDAASTDWDELLGTMKDGAKAENDARVKAGLEGVTLFGWAEPPHYDSANHKLYWAKDLAFGGDEHTLNYAIRVLGREGVLELNAVAPLSLLGSLKAPMDGVVGFSEFTAGNRYTDYNASTDKLAAYGIGALVAGGVAAKAGLFKGLFALLLAGKKLIAVGAVAVVGFLKRLMGKPDLPPPSSEVPK